jgi:hypothetical protein
MYFVSINNTHDYMKLFFYLNFVGLILQVFYPRTMTTSEVKVSRLRTSIAVGGYKHNLDQ